MGSACAPIRICIVATPNRLRHSSDLILENYGAAYRGTAFFIARYALVDGVEST